MPDAPSQQPLSGSSPGKKPCIAWVLAMAACPSQQSQRARMGSMENRWRAGQDGGTVDMEAFEAKINAHKQAKEKPPKAEPEPWPKLKPVDRDAINEQRLAERVAEMTRLSQRLDERMAEVNAKEADPSPSEDAMKGLEKKPSLSPPPPPPTLLGKAQGEKKPILPPRAQELMAEVKAMENDPFPNQWTTEDEAKLEMLIQFDSHTFVKFNANEIKWLQKKKSRVGGLPPCCRP